MAALLAFFFFSCKMMLKGIYQFSLDIPNAS